MSADLDNGAKVIISQDGMEARLRLSAGLDVAALSESVLIAIAQGEGVSTSPELASSVKALLETYAASPDADHEQVIARGTPPNHGEDERLELAPAFEGAGAAATGGKAESEPGVVDHYARSDFKMIRAGQKIGTLHPATEGEDGSTVTGKTLGARSGKALGLKTDASVEIRSNGEIVALVDGAFLQSGDELKVITVLEIPEYVDFSTGNIDFHGDVVVVRGVKDCFNVTCTGTLTVRGLVEAANLSAGFLELDGGMAARGKGTIQVENDAHARYLDSVRATIGRNLEIDREAVSCDLRVGGRLIGERAAIIGGCVSLCGKGEIGTLGSESGQETEVVLGKIHDVERLKSEVNSLMPQVEERLEKAKQSHGQLKRNASKPTKSQAEQLRELEIEIGEMERLKNRLGQGLAVLDQARRSFATVDLTVASRIHRGVRMKLGAYSARFHETVKGPVRITLDSRGRPRIEDVIREESVDLRERAKVRDVEEDEESSSRAA
ncbi:MAG: FapA family protein [Planctomycetota bacterium]|nr:FapA family protein [Planctomycetota bacterium]